MRVIRPVEIDGHRLESTNAPADTVAEYNPEATYSGPKPETNTPGDFAVEGDKVYEAMTEVTGVAPSEGVNYQPAKWAEVRSINPVAMFNEVIGDPTISGEPWPVHDGTGIQVEIKPGRVVGAVALFGLRANSVRVELIDVDEGTLYDETKSLRGPVSSYWEWFFEPITLRRDVVFEGLPAYAGTIRISIEAGTGGDAECGACVIGPVISLGLLQYGTSVGNLSFSRRLRDRFGRATLSRGDTAKISSYDVSMEANQSDRVYRALDDLDGVAAVWLGSDLFESSLIYGFYETFRITYSNYPFHHCALDVEGLT